MIPVSVLAAGAVLIPVARTWAGAVAGRDMCRKADGNDPGVTCRQGHRPPSVPPSPLPRIDRRRRHGPAVGPSLPTRPGIVGTMFGAWGGRAERWATRQGNRWVACRFKQVSVGGMTEGCDRYIEGYDRWLPALASAAFYLYGGDVNFIVRTSY